MDRKPRLVLITRMLFVGLAFSLFMASGCTNTLTQNQAGEEQGPRAVSKEASQKIATDFLRNSPTFRFDGIENTLTMVWSGGEEELHRWEFHYQFQSRHAGYGDRMGLVLAQVITDHEAQIVVGQGEIAHAVLDGRWDMSRQKII
jgi:hypothetical protein